MKIKMFLGTFLAFGLGLTLAACDEDDGGGKDVCQQAADVIIDDCGVEPDGGDGGDGGENAACEGQTEASAQCVLDHPDEVCAFFADPTDTTAYENYAACVADATGM